MATAFDTPTQERFENGPFNAATEAHGERHHNQPPLEERVMLDFEEALKTPGEGGKLSIEARIAELLASAAKAPETIEDEPTAAKVGDFIKLARDVEKRVNEARELHNRPLLNAQRSLKQKADAILMPLLEAGGTLRGRLNAYVAKQEAERAEAERLAAEAARRAEEEARAASPTPDLVPTIAPAPVAKPIVRGDLGSSVSGRQVWKHEIEVPIAKLPKQILENAKVVEAVNQVIAGMVRGGAREIKGVRIFPTTEATVR